MAEKRTGTITSWTEVVPGLSVFRLGPQPGTAFPEYRAGQYIALTRENCKVTTKLKDAEGRIRYEPTLNEDGSPKTSSVTHSYSLASAPFETRERGEIEIYITLEKLDEGRFGRFTESLFASRPHVGDHLGYVDRIVGTFTLDQRAADADHVVMVGTGTGLAPFVGMIKQTAHEARAGRPSPVTYTLIHANRTVGELGYDESLRGIAAEGIPGFDFQYVRSVSRPAPGDATDSQLCFGRANNLVRLVLGLPTREQEGLEEAANPEERSEALRALDRLTAPVLARSLELGALRARMPEGRTTVLTCGNAQLMEDIGRICGKAGFRFEMEEW